MKKKKKLQGVLHIHSSKRNTICSLGDSKGMILTSCSCGSLGFAGGRSRSSYYAASQTGFHIGKKARGLGFQHLRLYLHGLGKGPSAVMRSLKKLRFKLDSIREMTPIPHNGCRPPKRRRK